MPIPRGLREHAAPVAQIWWRNAPLCSGQGDVFSTERLTTVATGVGDEKTQCVLIKTTGGGDAAEQVRLGAHFIPLGEMARRLSVLDFPCSRFSMEIPPVVRGASDTV